MTKVIVLNEIQEVKQESKEIDFVFELNSNKEFGEIDDDTPSHWDKVMLLEKNYRNDGLDLIWAYPFGRKGGCLYLGNWNDGVVRHDKM